mmetsp:Transcript_12778/g.21598  ORF Transcript_12778/g.21598 Transcript_12778/m.21598 type:complete len:259 (+) Transcript_12778:742-1518(+)
MQLDVPPLDQEALVGALDLHQLEQVDLAALLPRKARHLVEEHPRHFVRLLEQLLHREQLGMSLDGRLGLLLGLLSELGLLAFLVLPLLVPPVLVVVLAAVLLDLVLNLPHQKYLVEAGGNLVPLLGRSLPRKIDVDLEFAIEVRGLSEGAGDEGREDPLEDLFEVDREVALVDPLDFLAEVVLGQEEEAHLVHLGEDGHSESELEVLELEVLPLDLAHDAPHLLLVVTLLEHAEAEWAVSLLGLLRLSHLLGEGGAAV